MKKYLSTLLLLTLAFCSYSQTDVLGCTDPTATNYNPDAVIDNSSCCYSDVFLTISSQGNGDLYLTSGNFTSWDYIHFPGTSTFCSDIGCLTFDILNYGPTPLEISFTDSDGNNYTLTVAPFESSIFESSIGGTISGCMDSSACNYDPQANCPGECSYDCYGCTDPTAINFDANATINSGTCCYDQNTYYTVISEGPIVLYANSYATGEFAYANYPNSNGFCMSSSCFDINVFALEDEGLTNFQVYTAAGELIAQGAASATSATLLNVSLDGTSACGDPSACNYLPNVTCIDNSLCDYSCLGCTDSAAINYDPNATIDDGSCCNSDSWATLVAEENVYVYISNYSIGIFEQVYLIANEPQNVCLPPGCYNIELYTENFDVLGFNTTITSSAGTLLFETTLNSNFFFSQFAYDAISGCGEPGACNYDPTVTCSDHSLCDYSCYGCTNPEASNFNPDATIDDQSCCLNTYTISASVDLSWSLSSSLGNLYYYGDTQFGQNEMCVNEGCFYLTLYSWDFVPFTYAILDEEGNVVIEGSSDSGNHAYANFSVNAIEGCLDPSACNYNPEANCWVQSSCTYDCYGCTDTNAANFNPTASINDNSCCYDDYYTIQTSVDTYWYAYSLSGSGAYYAGGNQTSTGFCMDESCFGVSIYSIFGQPISYTIYAPDGSVFAQSEEQNTGFVELVFGGNQTIGCADPLACNFDPAADCGYYWLCDYSCYGCTDPTAPNYNANATINDGSCCTSSWFTVEFSGPAFWIVYNNTTGEYTAGNYPDQNGFCNSGDCVILQAYSYSGESLTYTVYDEMQSVVESGIAEQFGFINVPLSFSDSDIPGCNDPLACNFNPAATCNAGNCVYYCGGCLDPTAINYDPNAGFDDGSCFYDIEPPMFVLETEEDLTQEQYYVRADVLQLGNGAPYILSNDQNTQMMMVNENGQYMFGPFSCGEDVTISVNSAVYGMQEYMISDPLSGGCGIIQNTSETKVEMNLFNAYPNPSNGIIQLAGPVSENTTVRIMDMTGRVVFEKYYDQMNTTSPLDLQFLSNGYYQIKIIQSDRNENLPIIIKK